jgi:PAS domain S-box-containing protein
MPFFLRLEHRWGGVGMSLLYNRHPLLQSAATPYLLGIGGLAAATYACFQLGFGVSRTSFAFFVIIIFISLFGRVAASVILSLVATALLNFFFAPPLFEFRIDALDDTIRIITFLVTSLIITALITKLSRSEKELEVNKGRLEESQRVAHVGWWERDFATGHVSLSAETRRIFGVEPLELPQWHDRWLALIHPEDRPRVADAATAAIRAGGPRYDVEYRVVRPDGTERVVHSQADVTWDKSGKPLRQFGVMQDVTELRQAERELRVSELRFRTFVDHATDAFFFLDDNSIVVDVNRQACESLGYSRQELVGRYRKDFDTGLDETSIRLIKDRIRGGETITFETWHRRKDGTSFPVEVKARQVEQGGFRFLCLARDITERKRAEDELRDSEERFRTLIQFSFDVYWETDECHRFVRQEFSSGIADAPEPGSEIGKTRWEVPYLEPDEETWRKHRETIETHRPFRDFELARPTPEGGKRYVSVSGMPMFDSTGRFIGYRGVGRHITERKRVEEALRRSEAYLAEAQRLSHTGTVVFNATSAVYWSDESFRIWGFDPQLGLPDRATVFRRVHPDDRERLNAEVDEAIRQRRDFATEFRIVLPNGTLKYIEATGRPLVSPDGARVELIATQFDVTERRRAKEQSERLRQLEVDLAHMNRLGIMGELTASLAHEILHPIATARNNARAGMRFLEMQPPDLHEVREALACMVRDADRAKEIVDRVRDHMKKAPARKQPFDLNEAVGEVIVMVRTALEREKVSVHTYLMEHMTPIRSDRVQLQQVLLNLIMNAVESMSTGSDEARELTIRTEQTKAGGILVAVHDSGPGIDPDRRDQVFQPFYTTKATGTGMGLAICRSIIEGHGGRLWAEANQPRGAVFQFTVPPATEDHDLV